MNTFTQTVYLTAFHFSYMKAGEIHYNISAVEHGITGSALGSWPHKVTLPLPENFNVHSAQVAALEAEKTNAIAAYQATVASINDRLSKLLALSNEGVV